MRGSARRLALTAWVLGPLGVVGLVGTAVWLGMTYRSVSVSSDSMAPTYTMGDRLLVERVDGDEVRRGDVVLYTMPARYRDLPVLQRVVGLGGDRVAHGGGPTGPTRVNGRALAEPYLEDGQANGGPPYDVRVPRGRLFLMGDHRGNSNDSRYFQSDHAGSVPAGAVEGRVVDGLTRPVLGAVAGVAWLGVALAGLVCGIRAGQLRRREAALQTAGWSLQR
ncbi:signal peptidase I [Streptomyces longispororuber]|uniref:signal peptidase I n=1 Tax=Streptomyces longispororuber TaxID=68230 RepID=UPI00210B2378|nr:signal peptidase I [Streptomyces longispororuber]MCQ4214266.1 signal peptidase I [Streptomyces longispororuber]